MLDKATSTTTKDLDSVTVQATPKSRSVGVRTKCITLNKITSTTDLDLSLGDSSTGSNINELTNAELIKQADLLTKQYASDSFNNNKSSHAFCTNCQQSLSPRSVTCTSSTQTNQSRSLFSTSANKSSLVTNRSNQVKLGSYTKTKDAKVSQKPKQSIVGQYLSQHMVGKHRKRIQSNSHNDPEMENIPLIPPMSVSAIDPPSHRPRSASLGSVPKLNLEGIVDSAVALETNLDSVLSPITTLPDSNPTSSRIQQLLIPILNGNDSKQKSVSCSLPSSPRGLASVAHPERALRHQIEIQMATFNCQINYLQARLNTINSQVSTPATRREAERLLFESEKIFSQVETLRYHYYLTMCDAQLNKFPFEERKKRLTTATNHNKVEGVASAASHLKQLIRLRAELVNSCK